MGVVWTEYMKDIVSEEVQLRRWESAMISQTVGQLSENLPWTHLKIKSIRRKR